MKTEMITTSVQEQLVTAGAFQISVLLTSDFQCVWTGGGQRTSGWCRGVVWEKSPGGVVAIDFRWKRATVRCVSILAEDVAEEYRWLGVHMDNRLSQRGLSRLCSLRNLRSKVLESLWSGRLTLCMAASWILLMLWERGGDWATTCYPSAITLTTFSITKDWYRTSVIPHTVTPYTTLWYFCCHFKFCHHVLFHYYRFTFSKEFPKYGIKYFLPEVTVSMGTGAVCVGTRRLCCAREQTQ